MLGRRQKQKFDIRIEISVHACHLELVFEVRYRAQAAQDDLRLLFADKIHKQAAKTFDLHVAVGLEHLAREAHAFFHREKRVLRLAFGDADDDLIEQGRGAPHQILVAQGDRVKRSRIHRLDHRPPSPEDENARSPRGRA